MDFLAFSDVHCSVPFGQESRCHRLCVFMSVALTVQFQQELQLTIEQYQDVALRSLPEWEG